VSKQKLSVFEYLYRDAGNYKTWGTLLLAGIAGAEQVAAVRIVLEPGGLFIAEQVGVPTLYEQLWQECETGFDPTMDHVWHEFVALRSATPAESEAVPVFGSLDVLVAGFQQVACWDERSSRNFE